MKKFTVLAWMGAVGNLFACMAGFKNLIAGLWFPHFVSLALMGAGFVICLQLIKRKSSFLPKARIQLLLITIWSILGPIIGMLVNDPVFTAVNPQFQIANGAISAAIYFAIWKVWCSEESVKYANA